MSRNGPTAPEVVVITGGSAVVGRATAQAFARRGARVGLLARGRERLDAACREIESLGGRALALPADIADADAVEAAAARVEWELGPIDVWVNNAMASVFSPIMQMEAAEFRRVTEVTYLGYVHGRLATLRKMRPRDHGTIVLASEERTDEAIASALHIGVTTVGRTRQRFVEAGLEASLRELPLIVSSRSTRRSGHRALHGRVGSHRCGRG